MCFFKKKLEIKEEEKEMITTINISKHTPYRTQRDNAFVPIASCQTTSAIIGLESSGIEFDYPKDMQPEDYLTSITETKEAYDFMRENAPWAIQRGIPPAQVHVVLEWAINKLVGRKVDTFSTRTKIETLLFNLIKGNASLVSGRFTSYGHVVCLVGFETTQREIMHIKSENDVDLWKVKRFIIDDPYGNPLTGYSDYNGDDVKLTYREFNWYVRDYDNNLKWAHLLVN